LKKNTLDLRIPYLAKEYLIERLEEVGHKKLVDRHLDKIHHFIDYLYTRWFYSKELDRDSYVPAPAAVKSLLYGERYYYRIIEALLESNIIESTNHHLQNSYFKNKGEAKEYRLTTLFRLSVPVEITTTDSLFAKKILQWKEKQKEQAILNPKNKRTYDKLRQTIVHDFSILEAEAVQFCLDEYERETGIKLPVTVNNASIALREVFSLPVEMQIRETEGYNFDKLIYDLHTIAAIAKIAAGDSSDLIFTNNNKGKRLFTNFSSLSRHLRQFIRLGGKPLVGTDIRNSQPLIFALFLIQKHWKENLTQDMSLFLNDCLQGIFYDKMMQHFKVAPAERSAFKVNFFREVFFGKNCRNGYYNKYERYMKENYPSVLREIIEYKRKDYKALAIRLQQVESEFILDTVVNSILRKNGKAKLITLHDAIYTIEDFIEEVAEELMYQFKRKYKVEPTITKEDYTPRQENITSMNDLSPKILLINDYGIEILHFLHNDTIKAVTHELGDVQIVDITHLKDNPEAIENLSLDEFIKKLNKTYIKGPT
jgi:hypothetical protein